MTAYDRLRRCAHLAIRVLYTLAWIAVITMVLVGAWLSGLLWWASNGVTP